MKGNDMRFKAAITLLAATTGAALAQPVGDLYWTETITGVARTMDTLGTSSSNLATGLIDPLAIDADRGAGKVFFTDGLGNIGRVNTDGTGLQTILTGATSAGLGIAVDEVNQKVWWSDWNSGDVMNANYDGTGAQTVFNAGPTVGGMVLDPNAGKIYMVTKTSVKSANMNGSGLTTLYTPNYVADFLDIALDDTNGKLYWTDNRNHKVQQANLNGSNVQDVLTTLLGTPIGIDVEAALGEFYVANKGAGTVVGASLNGANPHVLYTAPHGAATWGLAVVVPTPGAISLMGLGTLVAIRRRR